MTEKIASDVAEREFNRWADAMDLARKLDQSGLDAEDKKTLASSKRIILDALIVGSLVVTEESGEFSFTPTRPDKHDEGLLPIVFHEPDGAAIMVVDQIGKSGTHDVTKMVAILAAISKEPRQRFSRLKNRDWTVCEAIFILFFAK